MGKVYKATSKTAQREAKGTMPWLICESAIVAENVDPDNLGRIKVIIPSIDEDNMFDDWVVPAASHCLGDGFGMLMLPAKGQEVLITGQLGQKFNLVYHAAVYNEEMKAPAELNVDTPGVKVPKNYFVLVALLMKIQAQNLRFIAEQLAKIEAANIQSIASAENKMTGQTVRVESGMEIQIEAGTACKINGASFEVSANGALKIQGGNVQITGTSIKLFNRTVAPTGPTI